jgi:uncharacterized RDD family membrane protein YckC
MPEQDTQMTPPPGWGMPFPDEQPRVDAPAEAPAPPAGDGLPTPAEVAAASSTGDDVRVDYRRENQRPLDHRRFVAHWIDEILLIGIAAGIFFLYQRLTIAAAVMYLAIKLSYYFVCESVWGKTLGKRAMRLRVVGLDGRGVTANKIAARTIFRLIELPILPIPLIVWAAWHFGEPRGLLLAVELVIAGSTMLLTGHRRQRVGDLAAGTIVRRDDRRFRSAPESPLLVVYPLVWIVGGLLAIPAFPDKPLLEMFRNDHPYMAKIDKICEKRVRMDKALEKLDQSNILTMRVFLRQELRKIQKLPPPPPEVRGDVAEVIRIHRDFNRELDRTLTDVRNAPGDPTPVIQTHAATLQTMAENAEHRFLELGLPYCAS